MQRSEARVMKILTVVGARPNFMKAAPIIAAINEYNRRLLADTAYRPESQVETIRHILVHTGQHYDEVMSGSFFSDLTSSKTRYSSRCRLSIACSPDCGDYEDVRRSAVGGETPRRGGRWRREFDACLRLGYLQDLL